MFNTEKHVADRGVAIALDMLKSWRSGDWDGDRDSWSGAIPACWAASCGASSDTCVNNACEHFDKCPYMNSRAKLSQAQVIIANQDMVLADLTQRAEEQQSTALPPRQYVLLVDEAHNFPDKAVGTMRASAMLSDTEWLNELSEYGTHCLTTHCIERAMARANIQPDVFSKNSMHLVTELVALVQILKGSREFDEGGNSSWGLVEPEEELRVRVLQLTGYSFVLLEALKTCAKAYSDYAEDEGPGSWPGHVLYSRERGALGCS
jgi:Rad3-related DNA helicase